MKKLLILISATFILCSAFMFAEDIFMKTGMDKDALKKSVVQAALNGSNEGYETPAISNYTKVRLAVKAIALNDRASVVNDLSSFVKTYYNSPEFKKDFNEALKYYLPGEFHDSAYYQAIYARQVKMTDSAYEEFNKSYSKKTVQTASDKTFSKASGTMDMAQQYLAAHPEIAAKQGVDINAAMQKLQDAQGQLGTKQQETNAKIDNNFSTEKVAAEKAEAEQKHTESLASFKQQLESSLQSVPDERARLNRQTAEYKIKSNYKANLSSSMQKFLAKTDGVDFDAAVVPMNSSANSLKKFVNPVYEKKDATWKSCYRAGKEATTAARSFTQKWMTELK